MNELTSILATAVDRFFHDMTRNGLPDTGEPAVFTEHWRASEQLGLAGLLLSEDAGGLGGCWMDAYPILKRLGSHAVPLPIGETVIARRLLQDHGAAIPDGAITIGQCDNAELRVDDESGRWRLSGHIAQLPWGRVAPSLLLECVAPEATSLVLVTHSDTLLHRSHHNEAGEPRDTLHCVNHPVVFATRLVTDSSPLLYDAALLRCCQIAGALEAALKLSLEYVMARQQFGRPLSRFQAIQHQLARLAEHTAAVDCASQAACAARDRGDPVLAIACAKLRANRAIEEATGIAHQVHGAMGFTREHRLHHFTQRLWSWRSEFGNERYWSAAIGARMLDGARHSVWQDITAVIQ